MFTTYSIGEWLQVALALSIENFLQRPLAILSTIAAGSAVSTDRSGGHEARLAAVHILSISGWTARVPPHPRRLGRRTEAADGSAPP